jgi:hypothetical protein
MTQIEHRPDEDVPRVGVVYRCSVCRLELSLNEASKRLDVAPLQSDRVSERLR